MHTKTLIILLAFIQLQSFSFGLCNVTLAYETVSATTATSALASTSAYSNFVAAASS